MIKQPTEPGTLVWRVSPKGRIAAVALFVGGLALAVGVTIGGGVQAGVVAILWASAVVVAVWGWLWAFVPFVALTASERVIQNRVTSKSLPYSDIAEVTGGYSGLRIRTRQGAIVWAWAVQKSNTARWLHKRTRADEVAEAIMARTPSAAPGEPPTARP